MNDEELFNKIRSIAANNSASANMFVDSSREIAVFCIGAHSLIGFIPLEGNGYPWTSTMQVGLLMRLFTPAAGCINTAMLINVYDSQLGIRVTHEPGRLEAFTEAVKAASSTYVYKAVMDHIHGVEHQLVATARAIITLLSVAKEYNLVHTPNSSLSLDYLEESVEHYEKRLTEYNGTVHPMVVSMIQRFTEPLRQIVTDHTQGNSV